MAWWLGTQAGEGMYNGVQTFYDSPTGAVSAGAREMFGAEASLDTLTPEQAESLVDRYEGPTGIVNATRDGVVGTYHDWTKAVKDLFR